MNRRTKFLAAGAAALAVGAGGAGIAIAGGAGEDDASEHEAPITGDSLSQASSAALDHLGGGTVSETEVGDEESYYEVEVTREDGTQVDVQLDRDYNVVSDESDGEEAGDDD